MSGSQDQKGGEFRIEKTGGVQYFGFLLKKPVGHKSTAWQRRFFVLKESFLLYYAETERKNFSDKRIFNIHPKGIIPLSYCKIEETLVLGNNFGISINFSDGTNVINLAAEDYDTRVQWMKVMEAATKITYQTSSLCESTIKSLELEISQLRKDQNNMNVKLREKSKDADRERILKENLEELNQQLIEEKHSIEELVEELQLTQNEIKRKLEESTKSFNQLESDKMHMLQVNQTLQQSYKKLSSERNEIVKLLEEADKDLLYNDEATRNLHNQLEKLTESLDKITEDKKKVEEKLIKNEETLIEVANEKTKICKDVDDLKCQIQDLNVEKETMVSKLTEEVLAKNQLQEQLLECKEAIRRLELEMLRGNKNNNLLSVPDESNQQISKDVISLKKFFESFSLDQATSSIDRRHSRRYDQIKKLRLYRFNPPREECDIAFENQTSTPGLELTDEIF